MMYKECVLWFIMVTIILTWFDVIIWDFKQIIILNIEEKNARVLSVKTLFFLHRISDIG